MHISQITRSLVGLRVEFKLANMLGVGQITSIYEDKYNRGIVVYFDKCIIWNGMRIYQHTFVARKDGVDFLTSALNSIKLKN